MEDDDNDDTVNPIIVQVLCVMCYIYIDSYMLIIVCVLSLLICIQARIIIPQLVCFSGLH